MVSLCLGFVKKRFRPVDRTNMRNSAFFFGVLLFCAAGTASSQETVEFIHRYRPGEQYRIVGVNRQTVTIDGIALGSAEILTRIQLEIEDADDAGSGRIIARYQVSEEADTNGEPFALDREYTVTFDQDAQGNQSVPSGSFVPQVRNIPVFPEEPLQPGATWDAGATEVYDFRDGLGINEPVVIPVDARYEYTGAVTVNEIEYQEIRIRYNLFYRPPPGRPEAEHIRLITARFRQTLLWDAIAGRAHAYEEQYNLFMQMRDGAQMEYQGAADGRIVDAPPLDRDELAREIADSIDEESITDATVRSDDEGVTIAFENIQFQPDSAELLPGEMVKVEWLARILARYPDRDILITGHTALAGTEAGRQRLSEERAETVGRLLIERGARSRDRIVYRGMGAREPIADNDTEAGMRRNRRVEITILEN